MMREKIKFSINNTISTQHSPWTFPCRPIKRSLLSAIVTISHSTQINQFYWIHRNIPKHLKCLFVCCWRKKIGNWNVIVEDKENYMMELKKGERWSKKVNMIRKKDEMNLSLTWLLWRLKTHHIVTIQIKS